MVRINLNDVDYTEKLNELNFSKNYDKEGEYFSLYTTLRGVPGSTFTMTVHDKGNLIKFFQGCLEVLNKEDDGIYDGF